MEFCFIRKCGVALGLFMVSFFSFSDTSVPSIPGWVVMGNSPDGDSVFYGKVDTLKIDKQGANILTQLVQKNTGQITYAVVFMARETCNIGYGSINFHTLSGGENNSADYVKGGSSIGANMGDFLCLMISSRDKK